jgi:hypothetical protein
MVCAIDLFLTGLFTVAPGASAFPVAGHHGHGL